LPFLSSLNQTELYSKVEKTAYSILPSDNPLKNPLNLIKLLKPKFLSESFNYLSEDQLPESRQRLKLIHTYGAVGAVELMIDHSVETPYTGLFKSGGIGLARLSLAKQGGIFTPGMAIKLLVDGESSTNIISMYSLEGQTLRNGESDNNFFSNAFSNIIDPPKSSILKILGNAFHRSIAYIAGGIPSETELPLDEMAAITPQGQKITDWNAPKKIVFVPNPELTERYQDMLKFSQKTLNKEEDFRFYLSMIDVGTKLYDVYVSDSTTSSKSTRGMLKIGKVVLTKALIASSFGDEALFFRHPRSLQKN
jgi:hypothetical protein